MNHLFFLCHPIIIDFKRIILSRGHRFGSQRPTLKIRIQIYDNLLHFFFDFAFLRNMFDRKIHSLLFYHIIIAVIVFHKRFIMSIDRKISLQSFPLSFLIIFIQFQFDDLNRIIIIKKIINIILSLTLNCSQSFLLK